MAKTLLEMIAEKKAAIGSGNRAKTVKPPLNKSRWRILPGWRKDGDPTFYHDYAQHFIKDGAGAVKAVYVCVDRTFGKPCEICSVIDKEIKSSTDDAMVEMLKQAKGSTRVLVNALQVDGPNPTVPQILELAPGAFAQFLGIVQEWGVETLDLTGGRDIVIERTGAGINTKYSLQVASKSADVPASVMPAITNLDEYVAQESEEQARRALTNLNAVIGLLPPASVTPIRPAVSLASVDPEDATLTIPAGGATTVVETSTGDAELDGLLAGLG